MSSSGTIARFAGFRRSARLLPLDYLAWLFVATAFARAAGWIDRSPSRTATPLEVTRLLAALLCVGIAKFGLQRWRRETRTEGHDRTPVIATAVVMATALAFMLRRDGHTLDTALPGAPLLTASLILLAYAEEVYFREALPLCLITAIGARAGRCAFAALASQFLYAAAHLPSLLLGTAPVSAVAAAVSLSEAMGFGLLLLLLDPSGRRRVDRVIIHSTVNLSLVFAPAALPAPLWRGGLMCLLGGTALRLARWRATPPPDYPSAWQLVNAARNARARR
jgi:hypothetical protein